MKIHPLSLEVSNGVVAVPWLSVPSPMRNTAHIALIPLVIWAVTTAEAQSSRHIIRFTDKRATTFSLSRPSDFLSPRALDRRARQGISVDSTDLPVCRAYIDSIAALPDVRVMHASKWLNQLLIVTTNAASLKRIPEFPFVRSSRPIARRTSPLSVESERMEEKVVDLTESNLQTRTSASEYYNYGLTKPQIDIHNGTFLHENGFRGKGMVVAMLDAGYRGYLTNPALDSLRKRNAVLGTWDFVMDESSVNEDDTHGLYCLSIMASNVPGSLVGTSPEASYHLFRTEDAGSEYPVEEHNWAVGAERADSVGADLITSSLGYSTYDDPSFDYRYADMNGRTTMVTRAADRAAAKGMIVTNSAGNDGASAWKHIIAPSDGDSVLAVGATNASRQVAGFSSFGPSADGRVKPDVASVGWGTVVANTLGRPASGNGTSFSNPNIAGLIVCLWQAFPEFRNTEILEAVRRSGDRWANPDDRTGYGIPDMRAAFAWLEKQRVVKQAEKALGSSRFKAWPSPFTAAFDFAIRPAADGEVDMELLDMQGRLLQKRGVNGRKDEITTGKWEGVDPLPHGTYLVRYRGTGFSGTFRLAK